MINQSQDPILKKFPVLGLEGLVRLNNVKAFGVLFQGFDRSVGLMMPARPVLLKMKEAASFLPYATVKELAEAILCPEVLKQVCNSWDAVVEGGHPDCVESGMHVDFYPNPFYIKEPEFAWFPICLRSRCANENPNGLSDFWKGRLEHVNIPCYEWPPSNANQFGRGHGNLEPVYADAVSAACNLNEVYELRKDLQYLTKLPNEGGVRIKSL